MLEQPVHLGFKRGLSYFILVEGWTDCQRGFKYLAQVTKKIQHLFDVKPREHSLQHSAIKGRRDKGKNRTMSQEWGAASFLVNSIFSA